MDISSYITKNLNYEEIKKILSSGKGKLKLIQLLNKSNNHITKIDLLHDSIIKNDLNILKFLINHGVKSVNIGNENKICPIHIAAQHDNIEALHILIAKGADINNIDNVFLMSPIHIAINKDHFNIVRELIKYGANINIISNVYETIECVKKYNPQNKKMCARCRKMCDCCRQMTPLQYAIFANNHRIVRLLLTNGAIIDNSKDIENNTLFMALLHNSGNNQNYNNTEITKDLIKSGSELNILSNCEMATPLYQAAFNNNLEVVNLLIEYGADVNMTKRYNECPLANAAQFGYLPIVITLIQHGANVNNFDSKNEASPLYLAAQNNHFEVVIELVKAGANIRHSNKDRRPILIAMHKKNYLIVNYLLSCGETIGFCKIGPHVKILRELQICSYKDCKNKRESTCSACAVQGYCSRLCQKLDWPIHKKVCNLLKLPNLQESLNN